ncbi:hypothetical protein E2C01_042622 [Portunus trituberculatus]|uniref:Uncharacterized protein n=1 Tax=Portunus trituberculatus TaxID=210409 RepID=A0A5B7FTX4_PORTR|nr:hypothetical protein [Portunus trituberculatus]
MVGVSKILRQRRKNALKAGLEAKRRREARLRGLMVTQDARARAASSPPATDTTEEGTLSSLPDSDRSTSPDNTVSNAKENTPVSRAGRNTSARAAQRSVKNERGVDGAVEDTEYVIVGKNHLTQVVSKLVCGQCFSKLSVTFVQKGLDCKLDVQCERCESAGDAEISATPVTNMVVYSALQNGIGFKSLHNFVANLGMTPFENNHAGTARRGRKRRRAATKEDYVEEDF